AGEKWEGEVEGRDKSWEAGGVQSPHHSVLRPLGSYRQAIKLARLPHCEVADVDHLLHFAEALGDDLAHLDGDEAPKSVLVAAQFITEQADQLSTFLGRDRAPDEKGTMCRVDGLARGRGIVLVNSADDFSGDGAPHDQRSTLVCFSDEPEASKEICHVVGEGRGMCGRHPGSIPRVMRDVCSPIIPRLVARPKLCRCALGGGSSARQV